MGPYSFAVFISRHSGSRSRFTSEYKPGEKETLKSAMQELAVTTRLHGDPDLESAQLALRRCLYLVREMSVISKLAPEACAMVGRSVVEHALIGSYLALNQQGSAARLMKKQRRNALRLRDYFLQGDMTGALALLPDVAFIREPLSAALDSTTGIPDLRSICESLDGHEPFRNGSLATLLYQETYATLSNLVVHATPHSIERHKRRSARARGIARHIFGPVGTFPERTLMHAVLPAIGGLCGCLARALHDPYEVYDAWLKEAGSVDGYEWTGSIARTVAVEGLADLVGLSSVHALNGAGVATRALATQSSMITASPSEQLIAACEIIDRSRAIRKWPSFAPFRFAFSILLLAPKGTPPELQQTKHIATGRAAESPQGLLAALALVYAGLWPDEPAFVAARLDDFDRSAPHATKVLQRLARQVQMKDITLGHKRWKTQISKLK